MPFLSDIAGELDPTAGEEQDPEATGPNFRVPLGGIPDEVGRRTIEKVQPALEGPSVGQFFSNLASNVGEFATGAFALAAKPFMHPIETGEALLHPIDTAEAVAGAVAKSYKEAYTPKEGETVPGMILRRLYEKPFDTLMDASALGQIAFGGAGLATRAATAGVRGAVEGGQVGEALVRAAGGTVAEAPAEAVAVAQKAASATRAIGLFDALSERAKAIDPITIAQQTGTFALKTAAPDVLASLQAKKVMTDKVADRTATLRAAEDQARQKTEAAFQDLNTAERQVIWPYISGRVNFDRPVSEQLMSYTGEWVPLKGETIRPDALEAARQAYIPIRDELEYMRGLTPGQVQQTAMRKAMGDAEEFLGPHFDPMHPEVQQYVSDFTKQALEDNAEYLKNRATGEMRTSLDIMKEKQWRTKLDDMVLNNEARSVKEAESMLPRPAETTAEEAIALMGPQGGMYFPHSAQTYPNSQSSIKGILSVLGEANTFKENTYALYRSGVMEHQDPVKQVLRTYSSLNRGKTWLQMAYEAAEDGVKAGTVQRMPRDWQWETDPDVINRTHQPFHPGKMMTDELIEEEGQHMLTRLLELVENDRTPAGSRTIEATTVPERGTGMGPHAAGGLPAPTEIGNLNYADIMRGLVEQAENGPLLKYRKEIPLYKVPSALGHAFEELRQTMQPVTNPVLHLMDNATQWWNWTNLNVKLTRLMNNVIGNTSFAAMQGVHPFSLRGMHALVAAGQAIASKAGLTSSERAANLAKVFDLPGIRSGAFQTSLTEATGGVAGRLSESRFLPARALGKWSNIVANANQNIEAAYRAASLFYEMSPNATQLARKMTGAAGATLDLSDKIDALTKAGHQVTMATPEYRDALKQVNRYFNNYDRATPFERMTVRRIFPYYKFFKHSTELITRFPFEHPLKGAVARTLGQAAMRDVKDTLKQYGLNWDRDVPPSMQDSLPIGHYTDENGQPVVWMYNTKGPNPFSQTTGYPAEQVLQMLNPVVKTLIERATGVNLYTRERYRGAISSFTGREVDPQTGQIVDTFNHPTWGEAFLRSFWPYQTVRELVAQGRVPTDTASLIAMATNAPNAWEYDERGFPLRKPQVSGAQALMRFVGSPPQALQLPTPKQQQARKQVVSDQLANLYQRYPEKRAQIEAALEASGEEVAREQE